MWGSLEKGFFFRVKSLQLRRNSLCINHLPEGQYQVNGKGKGGHSDSKEIQRITVTKSNSRYRDRQIDVVSKINYRETEQINNVEGQGSLSQGNIGLKLELNRFRAQSRAGIVENWKYLKIGDLHWRSIKKDMFSWPKKSKGAWSGTRRAEKNQ